MRNLSILTTALVAAVLSFASCNKQEAGASSFSLPTDGETLMFTAGQTRTLTYSGENIEACTAKPPKGWIGKVDGNVIRLTAPEISVSDYESGGQVAVYARGTDKTEYVVYFPVQSEGKLDKTNWSIRYKSSEEPADYSSQKFIREDDPSSSMTGWAKDLIDGSYSSIWVYDYPDDQVPFYFVIDLGEPKSICSFDIWAQRGTKNLSDATNTTFVRQCGEATFEFASTCSGNGMADKGGTGTADWSHKISLYSDTLKKQMHNVVHLSEPVRTRYIRFTYLKGYSDADVSSPTYTGGALAELDIYGF